MNALNGIRVRILLTTTVAAFLCVQLGVTVFGKGLALNTIDQLKGNPVLHSPEEQAECLANPAEWTDRRRPFIRVYAYDVDTGKSLNPKAEVIEPSLVESFRAGEARPSMIKWFSRWGTAALVQVSPSGPCSLLYLRLQARDKLLKGMAGKLILALFVTLALTMFLVTVFAVRPIVRRLRRVRTAADTIGIPESYRSSNDRQNDDIGLISRVLDNAHDRMVADGRKLELRAQALEEHLADIAHDLRTPISSLHLALERVAESVRGEEASEWTNRALADSVYLMRLTENLHTATRLQGGLHPLHGNPQTDLADLVHQVGLRFSLLGKRKGIEVGSAHPDGSVWVICDPAMAEQALSNVVHNAVSHGNSGGHVALVLERIENERFEIRIEDDGPGVPPAELPRLVERTFRSDAARQRDRRGGGLGLAITNEICKLANWSIHFEITEPHGLKVIISGPLNVSPPSP